MGAGQRPRPMHAVCNLAQARVVGWFSDGGAKELAAGCVQYPSTRQEQIERPLVQLPVDLARGQPIVVVIGACIALATVA